MDVAKVLANLRAELGNLDAAIASFERLQEVWRGRGSPPEGLTKSGKTDARRTGKRKLELPPGGAPGAGESKTERRRL
jgi:hypothetical protein